MTSEQFYKLLNSPTDLNTTSYESLDKMLLQHPYCMGVRMLLLKKYKADKHSSFERHLALASMYAPSRGKLFDYLNKAVATSTLSVVKPEEKKTKVITKLVEPPPVYHQQVSNDPPSYIFEKEELSAETVSDSDNEQDRSLSSMPIEEWLLNFEPARIKEQAAKKQGFKLPRIPVFEKNLLDFLEDEELEEKQDARTIVISLVFSLDMD